MTGAAPAASQGDVTGVIAIMNIGAGDDDSFKKKKKEQSFGEKLVGDIKWMIANGAEIIMLQEVSEHWADFLANRMPHSWNAWREEFAKVMTLYNEQTRPVCQAVLNVWPKNEREGPYRWWRKFGVVRRRRGSRPPPPPCPSPVPATFPCSGPGSDSAGPAEPGPWRREGLVAGAGLLPGVGGGGAQS